MRTSHQFLLRVVCFLAALPPGIAFLSNVYGIAPMRTVTFGIVVPSLVLLTGIWLWAKRGGARDLSALLAVGFVGGLFGTFAYDVVRIPFVFGGFRLFAPISAYGVWILDADSSSRFTEVTGWAFHFACGLSFGMMYTLCMAGRHWAWAILWGVALETLMVISPFFRIFALTGNYPAIALAYGGHVAFGIVLGLIASHFSATRLWLEKMPIGVTGFTWLLAAAAVAGPLLSPEATDRDARVVKGQFQVEGSRLTPDWQRIDKGAVIRIFNPGPASVTVHRKQDPADVVIGSRQTGTFFFAQPGVYQMYVKTDRPSHSSFTIVEPVAETP
jgi:hypothetical protein